MLLQLEYRADTIWTGGVARLHSKITTGAAKETLAVRLYVGLHVDARSKRLAHIAIHRPTSPSTGPACRVKEVSVVFTFKASPNAQIPSSSISPTRVKEVSVVFTFKACPKSWLGIAG